MRKYILSIILITATTNSYALDFTWGVKAGSMQISDALSVDSDPTNAGIVFGWDQGVGLGTIGIEAEISRTISDGAFSGLSTYGVSTDFYGVYGTYRTPGPVYFKAKAGFLSEDVEIGPVSGTDDGSSAGLGIGFSASVVKIEIEYTQIEEDIDFLSVAILF